LEFHRFSSKSDFFFIFWRIKVGGQKGGRFWSLFWMILGPDFAFEKGGWFWDQKVTFGRPFLSFGRNVKKFHATIIYISINSGYFYFLHRKNFQKGDLLCIHTKIFFGVFDKKSWDRKMRFWSFWHFFDPKSDFWKKSGYVKGFPVKRDKKSLFHFFVTFINFWTRFLINFWSLLGPTFGSVFDHFLDPVFDHFLTPFLNKNDPLFWKRCMRDKK